MNRNIVDATVKQLRHGLLGHPDGLIFQNSVIVDTVKELAYQWCYTNAFACAIEEIATDGMLSEQYAEFGKKVMKSPTIQKKMAETFPF